jgi:chemotaxis signal transduction protein
MHLRGRIGGYRLLIPATSVLDVWTGEATAGEAPTWRGRVLPYVDGRTLLGEEGRAEARTLVAYGDGAEDPRAVILGLDEVLGSVAVTPDMLKPFPSTLAMAHRLFDGTVTLPGDPISLLRLRAGLDLATLTEIRIPER